MKPKTIKELAEETFARFAREVNRVQMEDPSASCPPSLPKSSVDSISKWLLTLARKWRLRLEADRDHQFLSLSWQKRLARAEALEFVASELRAQAVPDVDDNVDDGEESKFDRFIAEYMEGELTRVSKKIEDDVWLWLRSEGYLTGWALSRAGYIRASIFEITMRAQRSFAGGLGKSSEDEGEKGDAKGEEAGKQ